MSRHRVLESTPTAASGQLVTAVTAQPINSSQHGVSAARQLVIRFWAVTSWPCDELTGSRFKAYVYLLFYTIFEQKKEALTLSVTLTAEPNANLDAISIPRLRSVERVEFQDIVLCIILLQNKPLPRPQPSPSDNPKGLTVTLTCFPFYIYIPHSTILHFIRAPPHTLLCYVCLCITLIGFQTFCTHLFAKGVL